MRVKYSVEEPIELFFKAENSIYFIKICLYNSNIRNKDYKDMTQYYWTKVCIDAKQAVMHFLKGFIIYNDKRTGKAFYLESLCKMAMRIDETFAELQNDCDFLKQYTGKYNYPPFFIKKHELIRVIQALLNVYDFIPISNIREIFKKDKKYKDGNAFRESSGLLYIRKYFNQNIHELKNVTIKDKKIVKKDKINTIVKKNKGKYYNENEKIAARKNGLLAKKIDLISSMILKKIGKEIIKKIYLFGSYAYGKPNDSSDLDFFIIIDNKYDCMDIKSKINMIIFDCHYDFDIDFIVSKENIFYNIKNHNSIENMIVKYGRLLYTCKETSNELFSRADLDIIKIIFFIKSTIYPEKWKNEAIIFHTTQAIEKILKGYIVSCGKIIKQNQNFEFLWESAVKINSSLLLLNQNYSRLKVFFGDNSYRRKIFNKDIINIIRFLININFYINNDINTSINNKEINFLQKYIYKLGKED